MSLLSEGKVLKIEGVDFTPNTYSISIIDADSENSKEDLNGNFHRDRICTKFKIECSKTGIFFREELESIIRACKLKQMVKVTWYCEFYQQERTEEFYCGDIKYELYNTRLNNGDRVYKSLTLTLIEKNGNR